VTFSPDGEGTLLRLRHSGLSSLELRESHAIGWKYFLARLTIVAEGGDPGPDTWDMAGPPPDQQ
jgi:hypothetical protein